MEVFVTPPPQSTGLMIFDTSPLLPRVDSSAFLKDATKANRYDLRTTQTTPLSINTAKLAAKGKCLLATKKSEKENCSSIPQATSKKRGPQQSVESPTPLKRSVPNIPASYEAMPSLLELEARMEMRIADLMKEIGDLKQDKLNQDICIQGLEKHIQGLEKRLDVLEATNPDLYMPLQLTRALAIINLLHLLLSFLDNETKKVLRSNYKEWLGPSPDYPFESKGDICYIRAWWFYFNNFHFKEGLTMKAFWKAQLNIDVKDEADGASTSAHQGRKYTSPFSHKIAPFFEKVVLSAAEMSLIQIVGPSSSRITNQLLRNTMAYYNDVKKKRRNGNIHLFELLFNLNKQSKKMNNNLGGGVFHYETAFKLDENLTAVQVQNTIQVLEDIKKMIGDMEEWQSVSEVVVWFTDFLLAKLKAFKSQHFSFEGSGRVC